ncbi:MAG: bifunctional D-glycero-beta-D-manno-heptose-7-phosphate kinase/D-glycero-beta-D-manno-heptose 1-phosphate adenylyltransferase HldE, partial [Gammaproteobacteria bacterium]|nr:bifunctional D-glycero-beta-D-manno-heptose-7-phosphate kinase/D-glycero-beta-D-manno-heptose 1-phosphate adenylyltransferase HldE [Gammaproteobacteria bacterium]
VVGDVMLDRYWYGQSNRISPEAPVVVVNINQEETRLGGAGNVAANIASLGANALLMGLIGDDAAGQQLENLLIEKSIVSQLVKLPNQTTIVKNRVISRQQQMIRLDFERSYVGWSKTEFLKQYDQLLSSVDAVILSDYAKGTLADLDKLISLARDKQKPVLVDTKGNDFEKYKNATVITPNLHEFETVVGSCPNLVDIETKGEQLRKQLGLDAVLVTRSEKGMSLMAGNQSPLHIPTEAKEVFDVTGAGDTVIATLSVALASGLSLSKAAILSNKAAGVVVSKLGTAVIHIDELNEQTLLSTKSAPIYTASELNIIIKKAKSNALKVVMTNGCFDILHPGHIDYLEKARALGDMLFVAVNDDESVKRLKGEKRPINSLASRLKMLSSLACVTGVVPFSEDTPETLYCHLLPDILVKGGDYHISQIAGADCVLKNKGQVLTLDFLEGYSSTAIVEKIQNS